MQQSNETIHVVEHGSGERVFVGLHGWNGTHRTFDPLVDRLPDDVTFLSVDLPGYGRSARPEEWTLASVGRAIVGAVDRRGVDRFSVVGSCSGALVGLYVGRAAGRRINRLIMLEPFAFIPWYLGLFLWPLVGRLFYWSAFGNPAGRAITNWALADNRDDETDLMASFADNALEVPLRYLQLFDTIESPHVFGDVPGHKEIVSAEHTFGAVRRSVDLWLEVWPEATRRQIDGAGHLLIDEATDTLRRLVFA